ncbi:MAG: hypothetical protein KAW61_06845 [candidate division Zixibacteria bacterium]|nr:hypothetical protein [candidate division Zixibacteria bacterium]
MLRRELSLLVGLLALALAFGCSSDDNSTGGDDDHGTVVTIDTAGGALAIGSDVTLEIPPYALSGSVDFTIGQNSSPAAAGGTRDMASACYTIGPSGTQFDVPAAITISYDVSGFDNVDEESLIIYTNSGSGWDALATEIDRGVKTASASVTHLSDFAVMLDTSSTAEGIYAKLVLGRMITWMGEGDPYRIDIITASFDSGYGPCTVLHPLQPSGVTCKDYTLDWFEEMGSFTYSEDLNLDGFLKLDTNYVFEVTSSDLVPSLTKAITFPSVEPYFTNPTYGSVLSKSGFATTWSGSGSGTVEIIMVDLAGDSAVWVSTVNDGSYSFTGDQLASLTPGMYVMVLNHYNRELIAAEGYDPRSIIAARVMHTVMITLAP